MRKVFVIAEAGVNHNGSVERAKEMVHVAAQAGADAIKFQTFRSEKIASTHAPKAEYQKRSGGSSESQQEMLKKLELTDQAHFVLKNLCDEKGIEFLSTPFDIESLRFLVDQVGVNRLKIASGDLTDAPLLFEAARTGKALIVSTGMSDLEEISQAVGVLALGFQSPSRNPSRREMSEALNDPVCLQLVRDRVTLLHCTTEYPAPVAEANLNAMATLAKVFGTRIGFSDHTAGISVAIAAVALGAEVIEKHFTLDRNLAGPDHRASLEPTELREMVQGIRQIEQALGNGVKKPTPSEMKNISVARKSLIARRKISRGEKFTPLNLGCSRPASGVSPLYYWELLDKISPLDFEEGQLISGVME